MSALTLADLSPDSVVTVDDVVTLISAETRLTAQDVRDLLACSTESLRSLVQAYHDTNVMPAQSSWDVVFKVLGLCAQVAGMVLPLVSVVSAVYNIVKA